MAGKVSPWCSAMPISLPHIGAPQSSDWSLDRQQMNRLRQPESSSTVISTEVRHPAERTTQALENSGEPCGTRTHDPLIKSATGGDEPPEAFLHTSVAARTSMDTPNTASVA